MGIWDKNTPLGTNLISEGDDRLRETKDAIEEALSHEDSTFPGATPGTTPIFIPGFLRGATVNRPTGDSLVAGRIFMNTLLGIIERFNGATWDSVAVNFVAGTKMVFYQQSPPTGWTAVAVNDRFLRVVTSGTTGGTDGGSGLTPSSTITLAHTHTVDSHTHSTPTHRHIFDTEDSGNFRLFTGTEVGSADSDGAQLRLKVGGGGVGDFGRSYFAQTRVDGSSVSGGTSPGTDSQLANITFQFSDIIIATKD